MFVDLKWFDENGGNHGVHNGGGDLRWWYNPGGPNGRFGEVGSDQTLEDFRASGPPFPMPAEIEEKLRAALNAGDVRAINLDWPDGYGVSGVHTNEGHMLWWSRPPGPEGRFGEVGSAQSFEDFNTSGPPFPIPAEIEATLRDVFGQKDQ